MVYSRELWLIRQPLLTERASSLKRGDDPETLTPAENFDMQRLLHVRYA